MGSADANEVKNVKQQETVEKNARPECDGVPGADDHSAGANAASGQHGPVEQSAHLPHHPQVGDHLGRLPPGFHVNYFN